MAAPIYKGGPPFFKPYLRGPNSVITQLQISTGTTNGGTPINGTTGTGTRLNSAGVTGGFAGPGSKYVDYLMTNGVVDWLNIGTKASPVWQPYAGPAVLQYARFALSSTQILGMEVAPVTVIPAPGAGFAIVTTQVCFEMIASSTAYANGGTVNLVYHGGSVAAFQGTVSAATVTAGAGTSLTVLPMNITSTGSVITTAVGVDITNGSAPFITGTGTAIVHLWYAVITQ